jgi:hypothetical protein
MTMSTRANQELIQFHQFLTETLASSKPLPSPEDALDQWRSTHPASEEDGNEADGSETDGEDVNEFNDYDETVAAIQEALDDPRPDVPWEEIKERMRIWHEELKRS